LKKQFTRKIYLHKKFDSFTFSVKSPLVSKINNATIIQIGDNKSAVALVNTSKHSYIIAVTSKDNSSFAELGFSISNWFNQN
ncbi:hypothetical protein GJV57_07250, partial [Lactobacillus jensenii]|nr:hypothetical protein [Lactobacillus jensenii]